MQALQQLWESARFTYQVNNPSSQANPQRDSLLTPAESAAEAEAGTSSSSDGEDGQQQPLLGPSQMVTRRAEQGTPLPAAESR